MAITGKPKMLKKVNKVLILDALAELGSATRVELSTKTKISQPTVNAIISELALSNRINAIGLAVSSGGRKAQLYSLNLNYACVMAVVVNNDSFIYAIVNLGGNVLYRSTQTFNPESAIEELYSLIDRNIAENSAIHTISLGVPGAVDEKGKIFAIPQIPHWEGLELQKMLEEKYLGFTITVENDINAIALGYINSFQEDVKDIVYIHVGEGIGAGIVVDGKIINGFSSFAGEIGYMLNEGSDGEYTPFETSLRKAGSDDRYSELVSKMVISMICVLNPPIIILGGKFSNQEILKDVETQCKKRLPASAIPIFRLGVEENETCINGLFKEGHSKSSDKFKITV